MDVIGRKISEEEQRVSDIIQNEIRFRISAEDWSRQELCAKLNLLDVGVSNLLERKHWPLHLSIEIATKMGLRIDLVLTKQAE